MLKKVFVKVGRYEVTERRDSVLVRLPKEQLLKRAEQSEPAMCHD